MSQLTKIAITMDDLPIHGDKIAHCSRLEIAQNFTQACEKHHLPPMMGFANMKNALDTAEGNAVIQHWNESGNLFGNHTFSHLDLEYVSEGEFIADIEKNEKHLSHLSGFERYFRYPFLSESKSFHKRTFLKEYLLSRNYVTSPVTIDFYDFMWNTAFSKCLAHKHSLGQKYLESTFISAAVQSVEQSVLMSREIFSNNIPQIMLLHMGMATSLFMEPLIRHLLSLGYQFISLEEALSDEVYQQDFYSPESNGFNFLQQAAVAQKIKVPSYPESLKKHVLRYAYNLPSTITL